MNVLDLFSGIGGFSLGLERAGMKTVAFCENDHHCQRVLLKHWEDVPIFSDIKTVKVYRKYNEIRGTNRLNWADGIKNNVDLICGGFPCQDISVAGLKKGIKGERSGLWSEFKRIIEEVRPRYAIIENVANLRNLGLNEVIKDLWSIGYACEWHIISARSIGACHLRERVWIIAYPNGQGVEGRGPKSKPQKAREKGTISTCVNDIAHPNMPRLWQPFTSQEESSRWWTKATAGFRDWWKIESEFCRMDDGLPKELDKPRRERIKQLGNSVVPQIPELIGRAILEYENRKTTVICR